MFQCECSLLHIKYDSQNEDNLSYNLCPEVEKHMLFLRDLHSFYHNLGKIYRYFAQFGIEINLP